MATWGQKQNILYTSTNPKEHPTQTVAIRGSTSHISRKGRKKKLVQPQNTVGGQKNISGQLIQSNARTRSKIMFPTLCMVIQSAHLKQLQGTEWGRIWDYINNNYFKKHISFCPQEWNSAVRESETNVWAAHSAGRNSKCVTLRVRNPAEVPVWICRDPLEEKISFVAITKPAQLDWRNKHVMINSRTAS